MAHETKKSLLSPLLKDSNLKKQWFVVLNFWLFTLTTRTEFISCVTASILNHGVVAQKHYIPNQGFCWKDELSLPLNFIQTLMGLFTKNTYPSHILILNQIFGVKITYPALQFHIELCFYSQKVYHCQILQVNQEFYR